MVLVYRLQGQLAPIVDALGIGIPTWKLCTFAFQPHTTYDAFIFFCSHISRDDASLPFITRSSDGELSLNEKMCPNCTEL